MRRALFSQIGIGLAAVLTATPIMALKSKPGRLLSPLSLQAPDCSGRPNFLHNSRSEVAGGFAALNKNVLVARDAEMWVEGKAKADQDFRVHTFQSFVKAKPRSQGRVVCGTMPKDFSDRFSLVAPTLIDNKNSAQIGNSMWQFQVFAQENQFAVWNKKSSIFSKTSSVDQTLKSLALNYRLYQISNHQYEMVIQKESADSIQTLSVRYEAL